MLLVYALTALFGIAGCFALWAISRPGRWSWWAIPGVIFLLLFAMRLTGIDVSLAGRAYAAYGGIHIAASLLWLWAVDKQVPDVWDPASVRTDLCSSETSSSE